MTLPNAMKKLLVSIVLATVVSLPTSAKPQRSIYAAEMIGASDEEDWSPTAADYI